MFKNGLKNNILPFYSCLSGCKAYNETRLWLGAKGNEKKRMSEEGFQFRYFQSAEIGAHKLRLIIMNF